MEFEPSKTMTMSMNVSHPTENDKKVITKQMRMNGLDGWVDGWILWRAGAKACVTLKLRLALAQNPVL